MSKIDELIQEYCPEGVRFFQLVDVATVTIGEFVHKNKQNPNGLYPVYNGGRNETGFYDQYNNSGNKIVISARGAYAGFVNRIFKPYWAGNSSYSVTVKNQSNTDWNYVYYYLKKSENKFTESQQKGGIPAVSKKQVESFKIPIPPLEVQKEIVNILDKFTQLEAELSAELSARCNQYEYYRNNLLGFDNTKAPRFSLGNVAMYSKTRIASDELDIENYVGVDNLLQNRQGKENSRHVPSIGNMTRYENGDVLIGNIRPYLKKIWQADKIGGTNGDVLVIHIKNEHKDKLKSRYLYHLLASDKFFAYNMKTSKGAKMPRGDKDSIMKFDIPVPTIEEQERVASILDKFDKLATSMSEGLPAEIEARRQQYEYYRTKLLTFQELSV